MDSEDPKEWFNDGLAEYLINKEIEYYVVGSNWSIEEKYKGKADWLGFGISTIYDRNNGKILNQSKKYYGNDIIYADLLTQEVIEKHS